MIIIVSLFQNEIFVLCMQKIKILEYDILKGTDIIYAINNMHESVYCFTFMDSEYLLSFLSFSQKSSMLVHIIISGDIKGCFK